MGSSIQKLPLQGEKLYTYFMDKVEEGLKYMQATGKIDRVRFNNPGMLIDLHNERLSKKKEKEVEDLMHDMNQYYLKLIIDTMEQKMSGVKSPIYKSRDVSLSLPDNSLTAPKVKVINT